jgi:hypothetical protein
MWDEKETGGKAVQDNAFYHFNTELEGEISHRIYLSAKPLEDPAKVVQIWQEVLKETGLQDSLCFKLPTGLTTRFETIVVFVKDKNDEKNLEKLLKTFVNKCSKDLLSEQNMPTGVPLSRGITMAFEPDNINKFLKFSGLGHDTISYNQLIAALTQISFELSYKEATESGKNPSTPKSLKDSAKKYFEQLLKLSGVNPDTMMPNSLGGKLPTWAKKY